MSYCRWSSMNFRCDVYVYEDVSGGWTTHVAGMRRKGWVIPQFPLMALRFGAKWDGESRKSVYPTRLHRAGAGLWFRSAAIWGRIHSWWLNRVPLHPIGLPCDGESFNDPTPEDCAKTLERLRSLGYVVPQYAIDNLREDAAEAGEESDK